MTLPASILEPLIALLLPKLEEIVIEQASKCLQDALLDITHPGVGGPGLAPMKPGFTTAQAERSMAAEYMRPLRERPGRPKVTFAPKATPALKAARMLQGKWLGTLRRLKGKDRARVKAVREAKGYAEAFKVADRLAPRGA